MSASISASKTNKMPADKKTAKKTAEPVTAPAPAPAAKPAKKASASKAEVVVPVVAAPVVAAPAQSSDALLTSLTEQLKALSTEFTSRVRDAVKATQEAAKAAKKEARDSKKKRKVDPSTLTPEQRAAWEARRANNAFLKQKALSPELAAFIPNAALAKLLRVDDKTEVTYLNLQKFLKVHFVKTA